jgi:hypothetical protein
MILVGKMLDLLRPTQFLKTYAVQAVVSMESDDEGILAKILIPEGATGIEVCHFIIVSLENESLSVFLLNFTAFYTSLILWGSGSAGGSR